MARKITDGLRLRNDGVWERQETIHGKRVSFSSKDPKKVWEKYRAYQEKIGGGLTFPAMADEWWEYKEPRLSPNTVTGYRTALRRAKEYFPGSLEEITPSKIKSYLSRLASVHGFARRTVSHHLVVIAGVFGWACQEHDYPQNPTKLVSLPDDLPNGKRSMPTDVQIAKVKALSDTPDGLFFYFLMYTGLRLGEALALQWQDIGATTINVTKSLCFAGRNNGEIRPPKTVQGIRQVIYLEKLKAVLEPRRGLPEQYVFGGDKPMTKQAYYCLLKRFRKLVDITPHQCRHAFATLCFEADLPARTLQGLLGHAQLSTSADIYAEIRSKKILVDAQRLNEIDF